MSAAGGRSGFSAVGPPSWKISSTMVTRLRTWTSGMLQAPSRIVSGWPSFVPEGGRRAVLTKPCVLGSLGNKMDGGLKTKRGGMDKVASPQLFGNALPAFQGALDFVAAKGSDAARDRDHPEIGIWRDFVGRNAHDRGMARKLDSVCDDRGCGVGLGTVHRENCDSIGNAERETATAPPACGHTTHRTGRVNFDGAEKRRTVRTLHHAQGIAVARQKM